MTVIFFLPVIIRDAHRRIFPLEILEQEGHNVIILDATKYFGKYKRTTTDPFLLEHMIECNTVQDYVELRNSFSQDPVLYVTNSSYLRLARNILNILVREQDKLLAANTRSFAGLYTYHKGIRKFTDDFIRITDHYIRWDFFKVYYKYLRGNFIPDYFLGSTEFLLPLKAYMTVGRESRFIVHSDDFNQVYEPVKSYIDTKKRVGVFIDQMIPYITPNNADAYSKDWKEQYKNDYYKNLKSCLNKLKLHFNLEEVVIALHPEAKTLRKEIDLKFEGFKTFENVSHELIRDSAMVFGHFSTVIGFAIFYKKPIILIKDNFITNTFNKGINSFINEIDAEVVNMDQIENLKNISIDFNQEAYDKYIRQFMKDNEIKGNSFYHAITQIEKRISKK